VEVEDWWIRGRGKEVDEEREKRREHVPWGQALPLSTKQRRKGHKQP